MPTISLRCPPGPRPLSSSLYHRAAALGMTRCATRRGATDRIENAPPASSGDLNQVVLEYYFYQLIPHECQRVWLANFCHYGTTSTTLPGDDDCSLVNSKLFWGRLASNGIHDSQVNDSAQSLLLTCLILYDGLLLQRRLVMKPSAGTFSVSSCIKPFDQPRDAARWEECSDLDEKNLLLLRRCGRAKGTC